MNRRNRFILTSSLAVGYGATLVPTWFSNVFTYQGNNHSLRGFYDAIVLVLQTGFAVTAFLAMILNLSIGEEIEQDAKQLEGHEVPRPRKESFTPPDSHSGEDIDIEKNKAT